MYEVNDSGKLVFTKELKQLLERIQRQGNQDITYQTDLQTYKTQEHWAYPKDTAGKLVGDCEDIALYKHRLLIAAGLPEGPLLMTICQDPASNGHCVLTVVTDKRDYILCNNHKSLSTPLEMRHEGYVFLYRQQLNHKLNEPFDVLKV